MGQELKARSDSMKRLCVRNSIKSIQTMLHPPSECQSKVSPIFRFFLVKFTHALARVSACENAGIQSFSISQRTPFTLTTTHILSLDLQDSAFHKTGRGVFTV